MFKHLSYVPRQLQIAEGDVGLAMMQLDRDEPHAPRPAASHAVKRGVVDNTSAAPRKADTLGEHCADVQPAAMQSVVTLCTVCAGQPRFFRHVSYVPRQLQMLSGVGLDMMQLDRAELHDVRPEGEERQEEVGGEPGTGHSGQQ